MLVAMTIKRKKKTFDISLTKAYQLLTYFTKLASVHLLHIPRGEWPYCALIKTEHSSKLYWADLKIIWKYILYYILFDDPWPSFFKSYWSIENFAAGVFDLYILWNFNIILIGNLWMDLFENKFDLHKCAYFIIAL